MRAAPGDPTVLGARPDSTGTSFALAAPRAGGVELCLFDDADAERRVGLEQRPGSSVWHGRVEGVRPGQRYGYRVDGPWDPANGLRFNPSKLLIDPYAHAIDGDVRWEAGHPYGHVAGDVANIDRTDSAPAVPRGVVVDQTFGWGDDTAPRRAWEDTVLYELHVKGFTKLLPGVPEELRGTYAGLGSDAAITHLVDLGVTAVELLPIHHLAAEPFLRERGLTNYWGYSSIGFLAPNSGYAATGTRGEQVRELKETVRALHRAGIEVILDVVFNHTAEGNETGPTLSFRGIDNPGYYRLDAADRRGYFDVTGTGNTLDATNPAVLRLIMDSLRLFATEYHVDGFRFDLATALCRDGHHFDRSAAFLDIVHQDPVLRDLKLIAEPWDVGEGGYQVGAFPEGWSEWNDKYRDTMRDFWRGQASIAGFARRFTGSSDIFQPGGRGPTASINFVTCHDGFTLRDLVTYEHKRNEANGEENRDGTNDNRSWNCGTEGETDEPEILALRGRQQKNLLATLLLSQGVPMLTAGDELGRTQHGNNNAYCQDNELSWLDWSDVDQELLAFTRSLLALRRAHPALRRARFFTGEPGSEATADIDWFRPDGQAMVAEDWHDGGIHALGARLAGDPLLLVLVNGAPDPIGFTLPAGSDRWTLEVSTAHPHLEPGAVDVAAGETSAVEARSLLVLRSATTLPHARDA